MNPRIEAILKTISQISVVAGLVFIYHGATEMRSFHLRQNQCQMSPTLFKNSPDAWGEYPVRFELIGVPKEAVPAIMRAAGNWNSNLGFEAIRILENPSALDLLPIHKINEIKWITKNWSFETTVEANTQAGPIGSAIANADIEINAVNFRLNVTEHRNAAGDLDLESLMIHEFGHGLGLNHKNYSVMQPRLANGQIRRDIDDESIAQVQCLRRYPPPSVNGFRYVEYLAVYWAKSLVASGKSAKERTASGI